MRFSLICAICLLVQTIAASAQPPKQASSPQVREFAAWDKYVPAITAWVSRDFFNQGELIPSVIDARSFNKIPTALFEVPCCGSRDTIYVVQIQGGKPVLAKFNSLDAARAKDFLRGSSTMHGTDTRFNAKRNAVVATSWDGVLDEDGTIRECRQDTYVWNAGRRRFDWTLIELSPARLTAVSLERSSPLR